MGRIRSAYLKVEQDSGETYEASVGFFAAWPIETGSARVDVLMRGRGDIPVAVCRNQGRGKVVVIADTGFAMNKNLEYIGGEPFEGGYENAHFWRWLITRITGKPQWIPPRPAKAQPSAEGVDQEERR
jgi:hypothetical protein